MKMYFLLAVIFFMSSISSAMELRTFEISHPEDKGPRLRYQDRELVRVANYAWRLNEFKGVGPDYPRLVQINPINQETAEYMNTLSKKRTYSCDMIGEFRARGSTPRVEFVLFEVITCRDLKKS